MTNKSIWPELLIVGIVALILGGVIGAFAFPTIVTKEVKVNVPVEVVKEIEVEKIVETFGYQKFIDSSWAIVLDEFNNQLEVGNSSLDDFDLEDEVTWEFEDKTEFIGFINMEKGKFMLCYQVTGEYDDGDDEAEQTWKVCHDFKNFEPRSEDFVTLTAI